MSKGVLLLTLRAAEGFAQLSGELADWQTPVRVPVPEGLHLEGARILAKDAEGALRPLSARRGTPLQIYW